MESSQLRSNTKSKSTSKGWLLVLGIILIAANLRAPLTSVGPLIGTIRDDLGISNTLAGLITTLPLLGFALLSPVAPKLARRFGTPAVLFGSLFLLLIGMVLRSFWGISSLLIGTVILGLAISVCNVLMPSLIKENYPLRIGVMIGIYSVAMNFSGAIASGISVPLANQVGLGWKGALGIWTLLTLVAMLVWMPQLRRKQQKTNSLTRNENRTSLWKSSLAWYVTLFMGLQSMFFYVVVSWLPDILKNQGMSSDSAGWTLSLMQLALLPVTFIVPILAGRMNNQIPLIILTAGFFFIGIAGFLSGNHSLVILWAVLIGIGAGCSFSLAMMFFGLRTTNAHDAAELSGMSQSVGYLLAAVGPTLFGYLHDATNGWNVPLIVLLAMTILLMIFGVAAGRDRLILREFG
ncbi:MFS transporter [Paenibacillus baekrokdamisoli]|uniref:MFS transporter n=1 Tax=Paenibacillus baekrokdamisoli TaxID=1712516 RepID=A0A3G9IVC1_9BACL|nr:MFS transporter [Paenibacillus baekrokdamisoli]MBB3070696.1 CP family cyanate transporter-like MFS transporter [Paenibacillus baekrokdamisoli]BBH20045.1 MFS transporter [Paenibacillus baekrokdamisoli]